MIDKNEIKQFAASLGFDEVGVALPQPQTWDHYAHWIDQGLHGEMGYLEKRLEERRVPDSILEGVKSIIVVAKRYNSIEPDYSPRQQNVGIISRYAWGDDYHDLMRKSLNQLCHYIVSKTEGKHRARACVDTAPLLERDAASRAGIGWVGKHTNLLNKKLGNWFFLGCVLTTLPLPPDEPVKPHCGTCRRCLDVCPTHAFTGPFTLDARKCISYLTIELKGAIPRELRRPMGKRIFGCDDCLAVCPWNRFAVPTYERAFHPRDELHLVDLIELMQLDDEQFRKRFKGSPVKRPKRRGFLRNVAVALGNSKDARAVPVLLRALHDHEPLIRSHAAWALGEIGGTEAYHGLKNALLNEMDADVRNEIQSALDEMREA